MDKLKEEAIRRFEPFLDFINADITEDNWIDILYSTVGESEEQIEITKRVIREGGEISGSPYIFNKRPSYESVKNLQEYLKEFLDKLISGEFENSGEFPGEPILNLVQGINREISLFLKEAKFLLEPDPSYPSGFRFEISTNNFDTLFCHTFVRFLEVIPIANLKKCLLCSRYFIQKTAKEKKYCNDECRLKYHNRKKADYMRRKRDPKSPDYDPKYLFWKQGK